MIPQPRSRSEFHSADDSSIDPVHTLEQHLLAGFSGDLALDLVLNDLVARAAVATNANAAALALVRDDEMVCRAATGKLAPDLGVALNPRDGLSGACLKTHQPQISVDTEFDPRVDPAVPRLGIRSILIVPVFDSSQFDNGNIARFTGVLEVFSTLPGAFSQAEQKILQGFAEECARIRHDVFELTPHKPASAPLALSEIALHPVAIPLSATPDFVERPSGTELSAAVIPSVRHSSYDLWSLLLGTLALFAIIGVSFLIGYRVGWLHPTEPRVGSAQSLDAEKPPVETAVTPTSSVEQKTTAVPPKPATKRESARLAKSGSAFPRPAANQDELVVYDKGKVIFRLKPGSTKPEDLQAENARNNQGKREFAKPIQTADGNSGAVVQASSTVRIPALNSQQDNSQKILLSPEEAQTRLLKRIDPEYPAEALASRRSGRVVLEVNVAENGAVASVHTVSGDPLLARAASAAVRNWRYEPYRQGDHAAKFQTDVTLSLTLPN